jgi:(5-formylfuran-3-yl)methyl phosphate synthase
VKLLISPQNEKEASHAIAGGADIIDVKNPKEGPLGANYPWIIRSIRQLAPENIEVSCTLGEVPNLPGSISLAALGAASLKVDYVKVGICGLKTSEEAINLIRCVTKAVKEFNSNIKVVTVGYADADRINAIDSLIVPEITRKSGADIAMIDTAVKDGKNIFDFLSTSHVKKFVESAHDYGLKAALAGSLRKEDLSVVYDLSADIAGLRGAACTNNDRVTGEITKEKVEVLAQTIKNLKNSSL